MSQEEVEVFSKETFLTSLNRISNSAGSGNAVNPSTIVVEEPPAMAMVREKHAQLHDVVGSLSEKERDFLAAYRAHMYNVQKELHEMREKIHRNETVENKTEKIKKIEDERDWYRKEALRLDAFTTTMTKDLKYMKENLEAIEEDRNWLEKQLKACKKQNKLLRAELDVRLAAPQANNIEQGAVLPSFDPQSKTSTPKHTRHRSSQDGSSSATPAAEASAASGLPQLSLEATQQQTLAEEREDKFKKQVRSLKRELHHKTHELVQMKRQQRLLARDGDAGRSQLESFFLQCVDAVKEDVARRRNNCAPAALSDAKRAPAVVPRLRALPPSDKMRGHHFEVELEDFTSADRVRLIERLLAHDEVLTVLYAHLFPVQRPATVGGGDPLGSNRSPQISGRSPQLSSRSTGVPQTLQNSASLPDATSSFVTLEAAQTNGNTEGEGEARPTTPVGSGAAAVSAARGSTLSLDLFTKEYLKAAKPAFDS